MPLERSVFLTKLLRSEHWPTYLFYFPLIPYYIFSAVQIRNPVFYLTANPNIKYSGNGSESKYKSLQMIPEKYTPKTVFINENTPFGEAKALLASHGIGYPLIAKPDIGFRGFLVKKIENEPALAHFLKKNNIALLLQEYIDMPRECGIFFAKVPGEPQGKITSITLKKFIAVTGNGKDTLRTLILGHHRAYLYKNIFFKLHAPRLFEVIKKGETVKLTVIGNHSKGTVFINGNHLIDEKITSMMDTLAKEIPQWNYGRIDIKYHNWEDLQDGKNFKILELNGIISEPTHIYDSDKGSYFASLRCIFNHWRLLKKIAVKNRTVNGIAYPKVRPYLKEMLAFRKYSKKLIKLHKAEY